MFSIKKSRELINKLKEQNSVKLICLNRPASICAVKIMTQIFHKELIKFELSFENAENTKEINEKNVIFIDIEPNEPENQIILGESNISTLTLDDFPCTCRKNELASCTIAYSLAKSLNYVTNEILWPIITSFNFYKNFIKNTEEINDNKENEDSQESSSASDILGLQNICQGCKTLYSDLVLEVKRVNAVSEIDGIYYKKKPRIPFLSLSSLFSALKNDINFIIDKKLFYKNSQKYEDRKIYEFLAMKGISQKNSKEKFMNLTHESKNLISQSFPEEKDFIKKIGHGIEISPIENFFCICHNIIKSKPTDAFLSLSECNILKIKKSVDFYHNFVSYFKESIANLRKLSDTLFFKIKCFDELNENNIGMYLHLYDACYDIYIGKKQARYKKLLIVENFIEKKLVLFTTNKTLKRGIEKTGESVEDYIVYTKSAFLSFIETLARSKK